jgi:hypothetical protein
MSKEQKAAVENTSPAIQKVTDVDSSDVVNILSSLPTVAIMPYHEVSATLGSRMEILNREIETEKDIEILDEIPLWKIVRDLDRVAEKLEKEVKRRISHLSDRSKYGNPFVAIKTPARGQVLNLEEKRYYVDAPKKGEDFIHSISVKFEKGRVYLNNIKFLQQGAKVVIVNDVTTLRPIPAAYVAGLVKSGCVLRDTNTMTGSQKYKWYESILTAPKSVELPDEFFRCEELSMLYNTYQALSTMVSVSTKETISFLVEQSLLPVETNEVLSEEIMAELKNRKASKKKISEFVAAYKQQYAEYKQFTSKNDPMLGFEEAKDLVASIW